LCSCRGRPLRRCAGLPPAPCARSCHASSHPGRTPRPSPGRGSAEALRGSAGSSSSVTEGSGLPCSPPPRRRNASVWGEPQLCLPCGASSSSSRQPRRHGTWVAGSPAESDLSADLAGRDKTILVSAVGSGASETVKPGFPGSKEHPLEHPSLLHTALGRAAVIFGMNQKPVCFLGVYKGTQQREGPPGVKHPCGSAGAPRCGGYTRSVLAGWQGVAGALSAGTGSLTGEQSPCSPLPRSPRMCFPSLGLGT